MKIADIKPLKNGKTFILVIDDYGEFEIDYETLVSSGLKKGQDIEKTLLEKILVSSSNKKAYIQALNYLSYKNRTQKEIETYLEKKEFPGFAIENAISKLKEYKLVNDDEYARQYILDKNEFTENPIKKIAADLIKRGIDEEVCKKHIEKICSEDREIEKALKITLKLNKKYSKDPYKLKLDKISKRLIEKGFRYDILKSVFSAVEKSDENSTEFENRLNKTILQLLSKYQKKGLEGYALRARLIQALLGKGYDFDNIKKHIDELDDQI
ncbi:regulatory protein RecX [Alkalibacter mobilis]|uniref:RecX family transcriptional regulator n=1 Tax=Alkalibacter mobilis TaxID=2787712 RepID=UPI00189E2067|nr:RecX family transcriptional regulator [Alkalibacter mobilis]MBF7096868.1 RecX family transcriptional regulator [Alkalibacter mobilis]